MRVRNPLVLVLALALLPLAGCLGPPTGLDTSSDGSNPTALPGAGAGNMTFAWSLVTPAIHLGHGLYEPTIDVSDDGTIYATAHTTGVGDMGAPAYVSTDDGATWQQLAFAEQNRMPEPLQGGTPPPSDEIFIVPGAHGEAWGVDVNLATFPVNGWCGDGAVHCYFNPDGYDEAGAMAARGQAVSDPNSSCSAANLNDRPWAAYANGTLLMVNNPGGGPVQVGVLQVPPPTHLGVGNPATGPRWNLCAGEGNGSIPGIPGLRPDGFFAVPQVQQDHVVVITGNVANVSDVTQRTVFENRNVPASQIINSGQVTFDATGAMFAVAMDNVANTSKPGAGGVHLAVSRDDGRSFQVTQLRFDEPVSSVYIDGNHHGPGAVISWSLVDGDATDWYLGHLRVGPNGTPVVENATLAVNDGPAASRHVNGCAVGPDGRAYLIISDVSGNDDVDMASRVGTAPLHVIVQQSGPTLPIWPGTEW